MIKKIITGALTSFTIFSACSPLLVNAEVVTQDKIVKSSSALNVLIPQEESKLNFLTYIGFEGITDSFEMAVHTFNKTTNKLNFQDGVSLINPGSHIFTTNQLIGIKSNGSEVVLDKQSATGGGFVFTIKYQTQINDYKDYTHFRIDVVYRDILWNTERKATADFTID